MVDRLGQNAIQVLASGGIRQLSPISGGGGGTAGIKWHPGYYGASFVRTKATLSASELSTKQAEIATVLSNPGLLGMMERYQWIAFQNTSDPNAFDFTQFDADYTRITGISTPGDTPTGKRFAFQIVVDNFQNVPTAVVPPFIYNDVATYGAASNGIAGTAGYCKYSSTGIVAALWRTSVSTKLNALITKIGAHPTKGGFTVDTDPYIEAFVSWEIAAVVSGAVAGSDWTSLAMETQIYAAIDTAVAAFPTTNKAFQDNFAADAQQTLRIMQYLQNHGCGFSGPDIWGKSAIDGTGVPVGNLDRMSWAQQIFGGFTTSAFPAGGQDLRGLMPCMHEIEDAETASYATWGPYTPQDLYNSMATYLSKPNNGGGLSHVFIDIIPGNSPAVTDPTTKKNTGTTPGNIGSFLTMIASNPIPFTGKPANYTAINTA